MTSILLVEDQENLAEMEAEMLRNRGYTVTTVNDAANALASVASDRPDVILLDLILDHHFDGPTLLDIIRNDFGNTPPVLVLSGRVTPQLAEELERFENVAAMAKPARMAEVADAIEKLLAHAGDATTTASSS